jgi:hypothetical protein
MLIETPVFQRKIDTPYKARGYPVPLRNAVSCEFKTLKRQFIEEKSPSLQLHFLATHSALLYRSHPRLLLNKIYPVSPRAKEETVHSYLPKPPTLNLISFRRHPKWQPKETKQPSMQCGLRWRA